MSHATGDPITPDIRGKLRQHDLELRRLTEEGKRLKRLRDSLEALGEALGSGATLSLVSSDGAATVDLPLYLEARVMLSLDRALRRSEAKWDTAVHGTDEAQAIIQRTTP